MPVWWPSKVQARADGCLLDLVWSRSFVFVRFEYVLGSGFCSEERSSLFYTFFCFNCVYRCAFDTPGLVSWVRDCWLFIWIWLLALYGVLFWFFFPFLFWRTVARIYDWFLQIWCFVAGAALFWAQGCVFYIGSSAVESARGENFGGADGAHFIKIEARRRSLASKNLLLISWLMNLDFAESWFALFYIDLLVCFVRHTVFLPEKMY